MTQSTHADRAGPRLLRRFALIVSLVFGGSLLFAAVAAAAGGWPAPGDYVFTNIGANASVGAFKGGPPSIDIFVNRGLNSFRPTDHKGPRTVTRSTMVQLSIFDSTGGASGCFVIPTADFSVSQNLQAASLHTTLAVDNTCPGAGAPVTGKTDAVPAPGEGGGLPLPITVDVTWAGLGVTGTGRYHGTFQCLNYSTRVTNDSRGSIATASGTVSKLAGSFSTDIAGVTSNDTHLHIKGTPPQACFGF